jgi:hypothetical protein
VHSVVYLNILLFRYRVVARIAGKDDAVVAGKTGESKQAKNKRRYRKNTRPAMRFYVLYLTNQLSLCLYIGYKSNKKNDNPAKFTYPAKFTKFFPPAQPNF